MIQSSIRGDRIRATIFLEDEDGIRRTFPDWLIKSELEKFLKEHPNGKSENGEKVKFSFNAFSWVFYSNEVRYGYEDQTHNLSGTMYDCQNVKIGKNELYIFKLEKIVYQETYPPSIDRRMRQLKTDKKKIDKIEEEVERIANDGSIVSELESSEKLRVLIAELNSLLIQHPNIEEEIDRLSVIIRETEPTNKMMVMYINIYSNNKKCNFVAQEILAYKVWPFPILQWLN